MTQTTTQRGPALLTPAMEARKRRNRELLEDYVRLMDEAPDRSRTPVRAHLMKRHGIPTVAGYYYALQSALDDGDTPVGLKEGWRRHQRTR
ncbi:MAG: hypothetical protein K2G69_06055 [Muribaculaceae bacterium]|nr:hypothetical protein [Muribaculaceae bacterium]